MRTYLDAQGHLAPAPRWPDYHRLNEKITRFPSASTATPRMLTITAAQMQAFADDQLRRFIDASVAALRLALPAETAAFDDARLHATVAANVAQLRTLGFDDSNAIARALQLLFLLQFGADRPTMPPHLLARLRDPATSVEYKLEALEQVFLFAPERP